MSDKKRKSFVLHIDVLTVLDELDNEQAGKLFKAILANRKGVDFELDTLTKIALSPFKAQFDRDDEKYKNIVERNKNNGSKGGRPKTQDNPKNPVGLTGNPNKPKKADSDSDSVKDSDSDNKEIKETIDRAKPDHVPFSEIVDLYNSVLTELPKVVERTESRRKLVKARWNENEERKDLDWWGGYFNYIKNSKFLTGQTDNPFTCNFDWIIKPSNMAKIIEGNYHNEQ